MMNLSSNLARLKKKIALNYFGLRKPLKYILFDKIYSLLILNKNNLPDYLKNYEKNGFVKINSSFKDKILDLIKNLEIQDDKNNYPPFYFKINNDIKNKISEILNLIDEKHLIYFKKYFNSEILPAYINLKRNTYYPKNNLKIELFNDNYHNDAYLFTHFKLFINLQDIFEHNGPMRIVPKKESKRFLNSIDYFDRQNYNDKNDKLSYANTGQLGGCFFFDPTNCLHKAGIPEKGFKRDYLIIAFVCVPKMEEFNNVDIYKYKNNRLLSYAKPTHLMSVLKTLVNFYKHKKFISS